MNLPYGYSFTVFEQDTSYPPDVGIFMNDPYPTVADNLAAMLGYQLTESRSAIISLPEPLPLSSLPVIPKAPPAQLAPSMVYYQATTSPGQQITPMSVSQTFSVGDTSNPTDYVSANPNLYQLLLILGIFFVGWKVMQNA